MADLRIRIVGLFGKRWVRLTTLALAIPAVVLFFFAVYSYIGLAHLIDARLHGERDTVFPRVLARPLELRRGQSLTDRQLVDRLNDLGYTQRPKVEKPGEFEMANGIVSIMPRGMEFGGQQVRVVFQRLPPPGARPAARKATTTARPADRVLDLHLGNKPVDRLELDA